MPYINGNKTLAVVRTKYLNVDDVYPVGAVYISFDSTSPAALFGGTWERLNNAFLYATNDNNAIGDTGGETTHTLTTNEMPSHEHRVIVIPEGSSSNYAIAIDGRGEAGADNPIVSWTTTVDRNNVWASATGGGLAHNNMPPYTKVAIWKRVPDEEE